jgi:hypothetical protein
MKKNLSQLVIQTKISIEEIERLQKILQLQKELEELKNGGLSFIDV